MRTATWDRVSHSTALLGKEDSRVKWVVAATSEKGEHLGPALNDTEVTGSFRGLGKAQRLDKDLLRSFLCIHFIFGLKFRKKPLIHSYKCSLK